MSLAAYLLVKLAGVVIDLPPAADLTVLPAGVSALVLAVGARGKGTAREETKPAIRPAALAGVALVLFSATYLALNTVPVATSQDETAILSGARELATEGTLRVTSPLNDRYDTNIIGALHVMYRSPTEMYYRTFPGTALLYAPFSLLPDGSGYYLFTASFGTLAVLALYLVALKLLGSWWGALAAALVFAVSPAFGHWAVTVYNNVPVVALELSALAVVLWSPRERVWQFALAGALLSVAYFARITEVFYVVPILVLVWWRTKTWRSAGAFAGACAAGALLLVGTNLIFYRDALFLPHVGNWYIPLSQTGDTTIQESTSTLIDRYAMFATGTAQSVSSFDPVDQLQNVWFHARYLLSSTFAFPFMALALLGLAWSAANRRRSAWVLVAGSAAVVLIVLGTYGTKSNNYYGFGESIARSSFVRYSLPIYALLSVGAAACILEARRLLRGSVLERLFPVAVCGVILIAGISKSYDASVYGFNRLNAYREHDLSAWRDIRAILDREPVKPLVITGASGEKLIDSEYELTTINYDSVPPFMRPHYALAVAKNVSDRPVVLVLSQVNRADKELQTLIYSQYRPTMLLHAGDFRVERLSFAPAAYALAFVDVWNTYNALDRWEVTPEGYLKTTHGNSYLQLPVVDLNGDGRVDETITLEFEILDIGPADASISGLDSRSSYEPVTLWHQPIGQTGEWFMATVTLHKGQYLEDRLIVGKGLALRKIGVVSVGGP